MPEIVYSSLSLVLFLNSMISFIGLSCFLALLVCLCIGLTPEDKDGWSVDSKNILLELRPIFTRLELGALSIPNSRSVTVVMDSYTRWPV